jgi:hypothetical protein
MDNLNEEISRIKQVMGIIYENNNPNQQWELLKGYLQKNNGYLPDYNAGIDIDEIDNEHGMVDCFSADGRFLRFTKDHNTVLKFDNNHSKSIRWGSWSWDGTKPIITPYNKEITKNASGYAETEDDIFKNHKILSVGSNNSAVKDFQAKLYFIYEPEIKAGKLPNPGCDPNRGYYKNFCDGIYGQKTKQLVMKFQQDNNLNVDGIIGNQTAIELSFNK